MLRVAEHPSRADLQAFGSRIGSVASLDDLRPELAGVPAAPKADAGMALGVLVIANSELVLAAVARALQQAQLGAIVLHATSEPQLLPSLAAIRKASTYPSAASAGSVMAWLSSYVTLPASSSLSNFVFTISLNRVSSRCTLYFCKRTWRRHWLYPCNSWGCLLCCWAPQSSLLSWFRATQRW